MRKLNNIKHQAGSVPVKRKVSCLFCMKERSMPSPGAIIFFDWEHDGTCDHVGIVERCDGTTVYTIEGNSGDAVKERSYAISSDSIMGYGRVVY